MINLSATTDKIELITSSGADIDACCDYTEAPNTILPTSNIIIDLKDTSITTATTTDVSGSPAASSTRNVKEFSFRNIDASVSNDVTVQRNRNGTIRTIIKCTLAAGETLVMREGAWLHYDTNGAIYGVGSTIATQADMEAATSPTLIVTPGRQHFHPGHPKAWVSCGVAADIQQSYGVASLTDNGTGDVTVTFTTAFAAATYAALVTVEMTATTYAVANARSPHIRFGGRATGSCRFDCIDGAVTTQVIKDPTTWHIVFFGDFA